MQNMFINEKLIDTLYYQLIKMQLFLIQMFLKLYSKYRTF